MKNDPFASIGLDQQLYSDQQPERTRARGRADASARVKTSSDGRGHPATLPPVQPPIRESAEADAGPPVQPSGMTAESPAQHASGRTPVSSPRGQAVPPRVETRHSHNLFLDQVRWINRMKVEVEETYGAQITGNSIVQAAVDMIMKDYREHADDSLFVRRVVLGEHPDDGGGR